MPHRATPLAVTTGVPIKEAETAMFCVVALVDCKVTFPDGVPVAEDAVRTYTVVALMVPPDWVTVLVVAKVLLSKETSNPVGAVTVAFADKLDPVNVKD